jgi:hypothetical protein
LKIGEFRALAKEELPEAPWISKLLDPLNRFLLIVRAALANGLTFADNFNAEIRTIDVTTRDEWTALTLGAKYANWTNPDFYQGASYRWTDSGVELRGLVSPQSGATTTDPVTTLPAALRPPKSRAFHVASATANTLVLVGANGNVLVSEGAAPVAGAWISLDGIRFEAAGPRAANGAFPLRWKSKVRGKVTGIDILRAVEVVDRVEKPVLSALGIDWAQDGENTIIAGVAGLTGGKTYRLTVVAFGGG